MQATMIKLLTIHVLSQVSLTAQPPVKKLGQYVEKWNINV